MLPYIYHPLRYYDPSVGCTGISKYKVSLLTNTFFSFLVATNEYTLSLLFFVRLCSAEVCTTSVAVLCRTRRQSVLFFFLLAIINTGRRDSPQQKYIYTAQQYNRDRQSRLSPSEHVYICLVQQPKTHVAGRYNNSQL